MKPKVRYSGWFKKEAAKLVKAKAEISALRVERRAVLQDIEDAKQYVSDIEHAIMVMENEKEKRRKELAKRFASYDEDFRREVMLDPSLLQ